MADTSLYTQMVSDVISLTKRSDLEEETAVAVRTATLSVHSGAAFPRDLYTSVVKIPNPSYTVAVDAQSLPRLRGLSTVRFLDSNYNPIEAIQVEILELDDLVDPVYKSPKTDVCYSAGTSVNMRASIPIYGALITYFQLPKVRPDQYDSWIAQISPDAIVYVAASIVLGTNGNEEKSANYMRLYEKTLKPELIANFLTSAMR